MSHDRSGQRVIPEASFAVVEALLESGQLEPAKTQFEKLGIEARHSQLGIELEARILWTGGELDRLEEILRLAEQRLLQPREVWFVELYRARLASLRGGSRAAVERITGFLQRHEIELDSSQRAQGHVWLGHAWFQLRSTDLARDNYNAALRLHELSGNTRGVARTLTNLGHCERADGRWDNANAMFEHAIRTSERIGDARGVSVASGHLGALRLFRGHFNAAASSLGRALGLGHETADQNVPIYQTAIGLLHTRTDSRDASSKLLQVLRATKERRLLRPHALTCEYLGELALSRGRVWSASLWLRKAIQLAEPAGLRDIVGEANCRLAEVDLALERPTEALERIDPCLADFASMKDVYEIAICRRVRAQALLALGRITEAREELALALKFFDSVGEQFESLRVRRLQDAAERGEVIWDIRSAMRASTLRHLDSSQPEQSFVETLEDATPEEAESPAADTSASPVPNKMMVVRNHHPDFPHILGTSPILLELLDSVKRTAAGSSPVLIEGETGTGKELLARAIHTLSPRAGQPFIPFNCGTSTNEVFDAEISGHVRGAFTGAHGARAGLARSANGGTLFLDEIADLTATMQPRLLRLLDLGEVRPVGSDEILRADVRLIAATHQNMDLAVRSGRFRSDLFYRLCTFRVRVPALRQRLDDLPILIDHFADQAQQAGYPNFVGVSTTVVGKMARYGWPGNLRELRNEIFRLAQQAAPGQKAKQWMQPDGSALSNSPEGEADAIAEWEQERLIAELRSARGSVATVARRLGISRARVYRLIASWNLDLDSFRS